MVRKLLQGLRKVTQTRWFPTFTRPIFAGLLSVGGIYLLGLLHIVGLNHQVKNLAGALAGLLVTAIVQKPGSKTPSLPSSAILDIEQIAEKLAEKLLAAQAMHPALASAQIEAVAGSLPAHFAATTLPQRGVQNTPDDVRQAGR